MHHSLSSSPPPRSQTRPSPS
ncbi:hypothetical protein E2C01_080908 [Portunus trituberculatus]|uniref:Uncharacterized protein n=1 Tax=Portunus trituberculatus TaxID=210409 RepID=A0A5B7IUU4_PORTR|nr:hypothetical protein [Portunus trituberculatus]